jgi:hypothetical protein
MPSKPGMRNRLRHTLPAKYGSDFVATLDGRFRLSKEVHRRLQTLIADLGGEGAMSHAQISLCRRAIWLELVIEGEEARIGSGGGVDIAPHTQLVGSLLAVFKALGLKKQARQVRLSDYLKKGESTTTTNG